MVKRFLPRIAYSTIKLSAKSRNPKSRTLSGVFSESKDGGGQNNSMGQWNITQDKIQMFSSTHLKFKVYGYFLMGT
jgi:hypothetical protein